MNVSILQENLSKALSTVSRCIAPKATLPILSNILIATDRGKIRFSSTNLEMGINFWIGGKIEKEGSITVPARALTEFVSSLPAGRVDLKVKKSNLSVSSSLHKATFNGTAASEFPKVPSFSGEKILSFKKENLSKIFSQVIFAASQDEDRPVLTGVLVKRGGKKLSLVATDGYRLSVKEIEAASASFKEKLLIPAKTLSEIGRLSQELGEEDEEVRVGLTKEKNQIVFVFPNLELSSRLIEGDFPDFTKIMPSSTNTSVSLDKEEFLRAVKIASIFAREQANIVKFVISSSNTSGKIKISSETPQIGTNQSEIETKVEGEDLEIAFNCRFLLDFLGSVEGEEIIFEANDSLSPGVFKIAGDSSLTHIIMPVRIQD